MNFASMGPWEFLFALFVLLPALLFSAVWVARRLWRAAR